jgi:ubiquinone/menaquinone biosynthesis C-methylase UbiE
MAEQKIRFEDGAAYERMMGAWSRLAGEVFLDWLTLPKGLRCVDVGCGNGAFTELLIARCAPDEVQGIDPSKGQLDFARTRPGTRLAQFQLGDAMTLLFADNTFDAAFMALVIFFVPEPAKGVAEMARVVRPGGTVAAYAWDWMGGGFPLYMLQQEMRAIGLKILAPPSAEASRKDVMQRLWTDAGLESVETRVISVQRSFADFEDYWMTALLAGSAGPTIMAMPPGDVEKLKNRVCAKLRTDAAGRITCSAFANAVKGRVPE